MAVVTNKTLFDSASTASFEWISDSGGESGTIIDVSALSGAGSSSNQSVTITKIEASIVNTDITQASSVTLTWGTGTDAIYLPPGLTDMKVSLEPDGNGLGDGDLDIAVANGTSVFLRIYTSKRTGFPLSMGHSKYRP